MSKAELLQLTEKQIASLQQTGCNCEDWSKVRVSKDFEPRRVANTVFAGEISIGSLAGEVTTPRGIVHPCGIYQANLSNVSIAEGCRIAGVGGWLHNLDIADGVNIENVGTISCSSKTSFGNGCEIEVFNEGGGRELRITEITSAQIAYLTVMYRHNQELIVALDKLVDKFVAGVTSERVAIGAKTCIENCQLIDKVKIGEAAVISGVTSLLEGTIVSTREAPTIVENGVIAQDFIFQQGSSVKDGAMITRSLIGEGAKIGKQFSAENSVFFANSEGFHSEACSVFAGPYSVTHHRSTLLIAAFISFYNAGSGTNQSNHMYKLGPLHQGIMERGCKTGSFSYLLWPSRVGAFSPIIGKHYANFDTSDFPFSYVNEEKGKSTLVPGMNFFTVGTLRDLEKWPNRDRRKNEEKLDQIIFAMLSPYTGAKMIRGQQKLLELYAEAMKAEERPEYVTCNGIKIKRLLLKTCARYYKLILSKYFGDVLVKKLESEPEANLAEILQKNATGGKGDEEWFDLCGLLCTKNRTENLCNNITSGKISSLEELQKEVVKIHAAYESDEWNWFLFHYQEQHGTSLASADPEQLKALLKEWKIASGKLLNMVKNDAQKEFDETTRIGFGIDGSQLEDFEAVRGTFANNKFVKKLDNDLKVIEDKVNSLVKRIG